jgi:hypothetical protein
MRPAICGKASLAACCLALLTAASGDDGPVVEMSNAVIASRDEERLRVHVRSRGAADTVVQAERRRVGMAGHGASGGNMALRERCGEESPSRTISTERETLTRGFVDSGTNSSNPSPSSGESTNHRFRRRFHLAVPLVRIRFPPEESPQTIGSAGDFTSRYRWFESGSLQQRVHKPSVPKRRRPMASDQAGSLAARNISTSLN